MEVLFFLQQRTQFIRDFYENASRPFLDTIQKIEDGVEPFIPPYSEDGEPPFLEEWSTADTSLQVVGRTAISMLSASLGLYYATWDSLLARRTAGMETPSNRSGLVQKFRLRFGTTLGIDWNLCPADLTVVEQVVLARNRDQHPETLVSLSIRHDKRTLEKYASPFFVHEDEARFSSDPDNPGCYLIDPSLHISRETLMAAIAEVERLAIWLDPILNRIRYGHPI